jgi:hypothetical protein
MALSGFPRIWENDVVVRAAQPFVSANARFGPVDAVGALRVSLLPVPRADVADARVDHLEQSVRGVVHQAAGPRSRLHGVPFIDLTQREDRVMRTFGGGVDHLLDPIERLDLLQVHE